MSAVEKAVLTTSIDRPLGQLATIVNGLTAVLRDVLDMAERYEAEHHAIIASISEERGEVTDAMDTAINEETGWRDFYNAVADLGELCGVVERTAAEASHARIVALLERQDEEGGE